MVKDCPKCGLVNPPSAVRCDCGYDFVSKTVEQSYATTGGKTAWPDGCSRLLGYALLALGPLWAVMGVLSAGRHDPSTPFGAGAMLGALCPGLVALALGAYLIRWRR